MIVYFRRRVLLLWWVDPGGDGQLGRLRAVALESPRVSGEGGVQGVGLLLEQLCDLATPSWPGFRTFRIERRVAGDAARSVCSGYLMPEDGQARPPFSVPDLPPLICRQLGVPNRSSVAIRCWMRLARKAIASRSNGYRCQRPANFQHGVRPVFFHDHAAVGSLLQVRAPAGHFHIDRSDAPVVL